MSQNFNFAPAKIEKVKTAQPSNALSIIKGRLIIRPSVSSGKLESRGGSPKGTLQYDKPILTFVTSNPKERPIEIMATLVKFQDALNNGFLASDCGEIFKAYCEKYAEEIYGA